MSAKAVAAAATGSAAARAETERFLALEQEWSRRRAVAGAELAAAEEEAGVQALAGASAGDLARRLVELRVAVDVADRALVEARSLRAEAIRAVFRVEADELRARAAALRTEAQEREPRTRQLLDALLEHEECEYGPVRPAPPPTTYGPNGQPPGGTLMVFVPVPRTVILRQQADGLEQSAAARAAQGVNRAGQVVAQDPDQLRADLAALGPMQLAPLEHEVATWIAAGLAREDERRSRLQSNSIGFRAPTTYRLVWRDGAIDPARSRIGPPAGWSEIDEEWAAKPERDAADHARRDHEAAVRARGTPEWNRWATEQNALNERRDGARRGLVIS